MLSETNRGKILWPLIYFWVQKCSFSKIWLTSQQWKEQNFLSSPIACVACERTELLKTEIHVVIFVVHLSSLVSELFLVMHMVCIPMVCILGKAWTNKLSSYPQTKVHVHSLVSILSPDQVSDLHEAIWIGLDQFLNLCSGGRTF